MKTLHWIPVLCSECNAALFNFSLLGICTSSLSLSLSLYGSIPQNLYGCIYKTLPSFFPSVSLSRDGSLSPPPYVIILISCSGLVSFVLLLLTCLCCKRGSVGFNVSLFGVCFILVGLCEFCITWVLLV